MSISRTVSESENLQEYKKGYWTTEEDNILKDYVLTHGSGQWNRIYKRTGLKRCGKSCRMRWMNYLSPNVDKGSFTEQEQDLITRLYKLLGNRWSLIAKRIPGRTDNQIKNYCNSHLTKKLVGGYSSEPTITTSCGHQLQDINLCNNTAKNFNDVVSAPPKPDSAQSDVVNANTNDPGHAFWINEDAFELSSLLNMDFDF